MLNVDMLNVVMLNVVMLNVVMLNVILKNVIMLKAVLQKVTMLNVIHVFNTQAECRYVEYRSAECYRAIRKTFCLLILEVGGTLSQE
jgi:hypothetical protein